MPRSRSERRGRTALLCQVRAALLSVEYDDWVEADTIAIPAVAAAVRKLRRLMIAAATLAGLLVIPWRAHKDLHAGRVSSVSSHVQL